ncbi:tyrosine-type recombinase/integrase [Crocosphaera sp. Alani8]|uniref:tyrosine-type recombinase/integrase n=1 Tax=Crocosphaera sp. Alani8 TaxID=3038952 RepID=UPI00313CB6F0
MLNTTNSLQSREPSISPLEELLETLPLRHRIIVALAYFTSSKIEDVLSLQQKDITSTTVFIRDSNTRKVKKSKITARLRPYLTVYLNGKELQKSNFLFTDRAGKPLKSFQVFKVLEAVAKSINFPDVYLFILR